MLNDVMMFYVRDDISSQPRGKKNLHHTEGKWLEVKGKKKVPDNDSGRSI